MTNLSIVLKSNETRNVSASVEKMSMLSSTIKIAFKNLQNRLRVKKISE
jgi:hypothetical protein